MLPSDPPALGEEGKKTSRPDVPRYFRVACQFWHDETVILWPDQMKLLAIYLLTCRHRTLEGFFVLPPEYMAADLRWPVRRVKAMLEELEKAGFIRFDQRTNLMLIKNVLRYQQPENANVQKGVLSRIRTLPDNPEMLCEFIGLARFHCSRKGLSVFAQGLPDLLEKEFMKAPKGPQPVKLA